MQSNRKRQSSEKGFALATALMACAILFALAMLIIQLSTGDLKVSVKNVGDKKASAAAETGIHRLMQGFNPADLSALLVEGVQQPVGVERQVDPATDPASRYTISNLSLSPLTPRDLPGFSEWEQKPYIGLVTGRNTTYDSNVQIDVGIGFAVPKPHGYE